MAWKKNWRQNKILKIFKDMTLFYTHYFFLIDNPHSLKLFNTPHSSHVKLDSIKNKIT